MIPDLEEVSTDDSEGQTKGNDSPKRTDSVDMLVSRVQKKHGELEKLTVKRRKSSVPRCSSSSNICADFKSARVTLKQKRLTKSKSFHEKAGKRTECTKVKSRRQILSDADCKSDEDEPRETMLGGVGDAGNHFTEDKPLPEPSLAESKRDGDKRTDETATNEARNGSSNAISFFLGSFMNPFSQTSSSGKQNSTGSASAEQNDCNTDDVREGIEENSCNRDDFKVSKPEGLDGNMRGSPKTVLEPINDETKDEKEMTRVDWTDRLKAGADLTREEALELTIKKMKEKMEVMDEERHRNLLTISELQMVVEAKESKIEALESYIQKIEEHGEGGIPLNKTKATNATVVPRPAGFVSKTQDSSAIYDDYYEMGEMAPPKLSSSFRMAGAKVRQAKADAIA